MGSGAPQLLTLLCQGDIVLKKDSLMTRDDDGDAL